MKASRSRRAVRPPSAREALFKSLLREGFAFATDTSSIVRPDGTEAPWMLDTLGLTLQAEGARLAAQALLELMAPLEGTQLATLGTTAIPIVDALVRESGGKYRGLLVRKALETHGTRRRIEGRPDPASPVILVDDSIASGNSMGSCLEHVREAGLEVEAAVCLVRFGWSGTSYLHELGVPVYSVFDLDDDFGGRLPELEILSSNPSRDFPAYDWANAKAIDGLPPSALARLVMTEYLETGRVLQPPARLDRTYDARGGAWVSLRELSDPLERPARGGFVTLPGERAIATPESVVRAAVATAETLRAKTTVGQAVLDRCGVAVTFFGPLGRCEVGELDESKDGVFVRSSVRMGVLGGALPRMPAVRGAWRLYAHAGFRNAQLLPGEPHEVLRHTVTKHVEPGVDWPEAGAPVGPRPESTEAVGGPWARAAHAHVRRALGDAVKVPPAPPMPAGVGGIFVTAWRDGAVLGCAGAPKLEGGLDEALASFAGAVVADRRFSASTSSGALAVGVSFLRPEAVVGEASPEGVAATLRLGEQALELRQGEVTAVLLPQVVSSHGLDATGFAQLLLDKSGLSRPPFHWSRHDCTSWVLDAQGVRRLLHGLPERVVPVEPFAARRARLLKVWKAALVRLHRPGGAPIASYDPFLDEATVEAHPARLAHSAWVKARLGLRKEAQADLRRVDRHDADASPLRLLAAVALGDRKVAMPLARALAARQGPTGGLGTSAFGHGQGLLALLTAARAGVHPWPADAERRAFAWAGRRLRNAIEWPWVCWLGQALAVSRRPATEVAPLAHALVGWAVPFQSEATGGYLDGEQPDAGAGATTAAWAEGLAALARAARRFGDPSLETLAATSVARAFEFLESLTLHPEQCTVVPGPDSAVGTLRTSELRAECRLDFVQHAINAALWSGADRSL